ncbi:MAG: DUF2141 domain-containing protein [Flavobacteriales bacterium]|nr:DUF2141 domain-containing protein [Flavobacteriales bacterium]
MPQFLSILIILIPLWLRAQGELTVTVHLPAEAPSGALHLALCPDDDAFRTVQGCREEVLTVRGDRGVLHFPHAPAGTYAVKVFLDVNGNGVLDKNELGIPQEPVGFSNDAIGRMGPASFKDASFAFDGTDAGIDLTLRVPPRMQQH